jgi:hypothetical protein
VRVIALDPGVAMAATIGASDAQIGAMRISGDDALK